MSSKPLDSILATLTEDDLMYDHPVSMSGEPGDPVLYVRWEAVSERIAAGPSLTDAWRDGYRTGQAAERERMKGLVEALRFPKDETVSYRDVWNDALDAVLAASGKAPR